MERITSKLTRVLVVTLLCAAAATTASSQQQPKVDLDALAVRGEAIVNADPDPLVAELHNQQPEGPSRRGFYIGMAISERHTLPGRNKDGICASLPADEPAGCSSAVSFSVERNRNAPLASRGAAIAKSDPAAARMRNATRDVFYKLGFDIGLAAAERQTLPGEGKDRLRDSLLPALREGFSDAVSYTLERNRNDAALGATTETSSAPPVGVASPEDSGGGALEKKRDRSRTSAAFQPENSIKVSVRYKKEFGYKGDTNAFGYVGPTSCDAFSISALPDPSVRLEYLIGIHSDSIMEEAGGYYMCSYLVSDLPLNQPIRVSVGMSGLGQAGPWKGGSQAQPPPGQQRTIIIVSGRDGGPLTLTPTQPRAQQLFEMVYTSQPH